MRRIQNKKGNMQKSQKLFIFVLLLLAVFTFGLVSSGAQAKPHTAHLLKGVNRRVCEANSATYAGCFARVIADRTGAPAVISLPAGYGPDQFHTAYQLPATSSNPATIGIVVAYDQPYIAGDLATYNKTFGLPVFPNCSSTIKTACFQKVDQNGGTFYPQRNSGWGLEASLDVETAHQTCQNCKIILVEASSSSYTNLMKAVDRARLLGATIISNSYGSNEFSVESTYDSHFNYPGINFIFSSGDSGYGASYPAASPYVASVGGTTLNLDGTNNRQSESVWSGAGSGCSLYETKPAYQTDTQCANRTIADISADADPNTGAAVYDSYGYYGHRGWFQVGGTSLAAPLIAGAYALANNTTTLAHPMSLTYSSFSGNLYDVTVGNNGSCGSYLCQAATGYDGPTGLGTPNGLNAF